MLHITAQSEFEHFNTGSEHFSEIHNLSQIIVHIRCVSVL